jgi:hypothetical protein
VIDDWPIDEPVTIDTWPFYLNKRIVIRNHGKLILDPGGIDRFVHVRNHSFAGIVVESGGELVLGKQVGGRITFDSQEPTSQESWQGIKVNRGGTATIKQCTIQYAKRAITVMPGATVSVADCWIGAVDETPLASKNTMVGIHWLGGNLTVTATRFRYCRLYGMKEENPTEPSPEHPTVLDCSFEHNGFSYYRNNEGVITMARIKELYGNSNSGDEGDQQ